MENIPPLYLLFVLVGCALAIIAVWSRRRLLVRVLAVLALIALVVLNYSALVNLLGRPQPIDSIVAISAEEDSVVLAASIEEGSAIYLWLRHSDQHQPRYYTMAWDQQTAIDLKKAMDQSIRENSSVMMRPDYESSLELSEEPLFYALPHDRLPLKPPADIYEYRNPKSPI